MPNQDPTQKPPNPTAPVSSVPVSDSSDQRPAIVPPAIFPQSDLPPLPPVFQSLTDNKDKPADIPIISSPLSKPRKKFGGGKIIATILITVILAGTGIFTATRLYQLRGVSVAPNAPESNPLAWDCSKYTYSLSESGKVSVSNNSTRNEASQQAKVYINNTLAATLNVPALTTGQSADIGNVTLPQTGTVQWKVQGTLDCMNTGSFTFTSSPTPTPTSTPTPTGTPTPTPSNTPSPSPSPSHSPSPTPSPTPTTIPNAPSCIAVKAYDTGWNALTEAQLSDLTTGSDVNFCVGGSAAGTFDKAQFEINTTVEPETKTQRPGSNDFCQAYTILSSDTTVNIKAKIHDVTYGWVGESF